MNFIVSADNLLVFLLTINSTLNVVAIFLFSYKGQSYMLEYHDNKFMYEYYKIRRVNLPKVYIYSSIIPNTYTTHYRHI